MLVEEESVKATRQLHDLGQSLWLDNITRDMLDNGTLKRYIDELSVTGLTSNPPSLSTQYRRVVRTTREDTSRENLFG